MTDAGGTDGFAMDPVDQDVIVRAAVYAVDFVRARGEREYHNPDDELLAVAMLDTALFDQEAQLEVWFEYSPRGAELVERLRWFANEARMDDLTRFAYYKALLLVIPDVIDRDEQSTRTAHALGASYTAAAGGVVYRLVRRSSGLPPWLMRELLAQIEAAVHGDLNATIDDFCSAFPAYEDQVRAWVRKLCAELAGHVRQADTRRRLLALLQQIYWGRAVAPVAPLRRTEEPRRPSLRPSSGWPIESDGPPALAS